MSVDKYPSIFSRQMKAIVYLSFQMGHFCNADAIITPVGSYQIDRWMFLYEAYFVLLPTMYFQYPACGHRCLGRSTKFWLWLTIRC